ncbi:MAG: sulfite exporter TauE/SafE family protein [bacterium]|nr:sulfite exporter TauE/SafE family protein [bacterium]
MTTKARVLALVTAALVLSLPLAAGAQTSASLSATEIEAGGTMTITGQIEPGSDLYIAIASQQDFACKDTEGTYETKKLKKAADKGSFTVDTRIPALYYVLTNNSAPFGKTIDKKYGGPSFMSGLYKTTMFKLNKWGELGSLAEAMLGPIKDEQQWNMFRYTHENKYGINVVTKEQSKRGKITIFARSILTQSENYWDKDTEISLNKETGEFTATFKTYRHVAPDSEFDVYVNGAQVDSFNVAGKGFWLSKAYRYMNPLWIIIGAILVGAYFSMIGAAGGMLMAAFQILVVRTSSPVGIDAVNVLKPSNIALTLFSPLGSFYRYAVVERRVAWPVGLSFGVGIAIGSIFLGKYVAQFVDMKAYKEWLAVLVVLMGFKTIQELMPAAMEKRKNIKNMVKKFNSEVAKAKAEGRSAEMGKIEPVKTGIMDYRFKFWGEEFSINPLLFGIIGLFIGIVSRTFGIGGGFLLVPTMTSLGGLPMYVAVPISLIGTSFSSIGSFIGYLSVGYLPDLWLFGAIIIGGFVGGSLGSRLQKLFSEKTLKIVLAVTLFFLFFRFFKIEVWI